MSTNDPIVRADAGNELAGVPATPGALTPAATGAAVPSDDFIVTETSVNKDTSGPGATDKSEVGIAEAETKGEVPANTVAPTAAAATPERADAATVNANTGTAARKGK